MLISNENLHDLPVYTKSDQHLGQVHGFEIDTDTQNILQYHVRSSNIIKNIIQQQELIVHRSQVIEITKEKMVVDDNLETETLKLKVQKFPQREAVGVMSKQ